MIIPEVDNEDETMTCRSNIKKVKYVKLGY